MTVIVNKTQDRSANIPDEAILNGIRSKASQTYQNTVPPASANNVRATLQAIVDMPEIYGEFYNILTRIGLTTLSTPQWVDPLAEVFYAGDLTNGDTIQHIVTQLAKGEEYSTDNPEKMFEYQEPDVSAFYTQINSRRRYKTSISEIEARRILLGPDGIQNFIASVINGITAKAELDTTALMKQTMRDAVNSGNVLMKSVGDVKTPEDIRDFAAEARTDYANIMWADSNIHYNSAGAVMPALKENIVFVVTNRLMATMDVQIMASAFNMDKTDFLGHVVRINSFGDDNIKAILCDKRAFQVYNQLNQLKNFENGETLVTNYWLHVWKSFSFQQFYPAIAYVGNIPEALDGRQKLRVFFERMSDLQLDASKEHVTKLLFENGDLSEFDAVTLTPTIAASSTAIKTPVLQVSLDSGSTWQALKTATALTLTPEQRAKPILVKIAGVEPVQGVSGKSTLTYTISGTYPKPVGDEPAKEAAKYTLTQYLYSNGIVDDVIL